MIELLELLAKSAITVFICVTGACIGGLCSIGLFYLLYLIIGYTGVGIGKIITWCKKLKGDR